MTRVFDWVEFSQINANRGDEAYTFNNLYYRPHCERIIMTNIFTSADLDQRSSAMIGYRARLFIDCKTPVPTRRTTTLRRYRCLPEFDQLSTSASRTATSSVPQECRRGLNSLHFTAEVFINSAENFNSVGT